MLVVIISFCLGMFIGTQFDSQAYIVPNSKTITLEQSTGVMSNDWWEGNFTKAANYHCQKGYKVLEKSEKPSTLSPDQVKTKHYYWVIECE